jgi:cytochrome P450
MTGLRRTLKDRLIVRSTLVETTPSAPGLPPGELDSLDEMEKGDRAAIARRGALLGPIFKGTSLGDLCICVVGLQRGRRLLQDHADSLHPVTLSLEELVPKGFLRQMSGDYHRDYRRLLVRAARALDPMIDQRILDTICDGGLHDYASGSGPDATGPAALLDMATTIATATLIVLFFGTEPGSERFERLMEQYRHLGPYGMVWNLQAPQFEAFARIRDDLREMLAAGHDGSVPLASACVLSQVAEQGEVDDTMLGNLIYMVEMGRGDLQTFFRWLLRYGSAHPAAMARIAGEQATALDPGLTSAADAFVLEVLRMDQSERLMRRATRDFVFDGYTVPKGSLVRLCMWEAHHSEDQFADPYSFDPARFLAMTPTREQFSPFGLDHHLCPFAGISIRIGSTFLRALATNFESTQVADGPAVRGAYHWEPSRKLRVQVRKR